MIGDGIRTCVAHLRTQADLRAKYPACGCPTDRAGEIQHAPECWEPGKVKDMRDAANAALADLAALTTPDEIRPGESREPEATLDDDFPECPGPDTDAHASDCINPGPACKAVEPDCGESPCLEND